MDKELWDKIGDLISETYGLARSLFAPPNTRAILIILQALWDINTRLKKVEEKESKNENP